MLYLVMAQSRAETEAIQLIKGPDYLNVEKAERDLAEMFRSADMKYEQARAEVCEKYGVPYLLAMRGPVEARLQALRELKEKAPHPDPTKMIQQWIHKTPRIESVPYRRISFRTYEE